ncbi:hypothetical protein Y695_03955 [Hydrogenophaga sp. T4]|nr:hypothetical protein Y695_03955 [Hydrogenophaga sp. T4]
MTTTKPANKALALWSSWRSRVCQDTVTTSAAITTANSSSSRCSSSMRPASTPLAVSGGTLTMPTMPSTASRLRRPYLNGWVKGMPSH